MRIEAIKCVIGGCRLSAMWNCEPSLQFVATACLRRLLQKCRTRFGIATATSLLARQQWGADQIDAGCGRLRSVGARRSLRG